MKSILYTALGVLVVFAVFLLYAGFIHNQYFSNIAVLDKNVEIGLSCDNVYSTLEEYRLSSSTNVFIKRLSISSTSEWKHRIDVASTIVVNDLSTPFDTISYYVFCNNKDRVLDTYLVGD